MTLPLIKSIVTTLTRPLIHEKQRPDDVKLTEWVEIELSYWAKHFTKATEMVLKKHNLLLCDVLTIQEVNFLYALAKYSKLADEGEMIGNTIRVIINANVEEVERIKTKLKPEADKHAVVWVFISELESFQAAIKQKEEAVCRS